VKEANVFAIVAVVVAVVSIAIAIAIAVAIAIVVVIAVASSFFFLADRTGPAKGPNGNKAVVELAKDKVDVANGIGVDEVRKNNVFKALDVDLHADDRGGGGIAIAIAIVTAIVIATAIVIDIVIVNVIVNVTAIAIVIVIVIVIAIVIVIVIVILSATAILTAFAETGGKFRNDPPVDVVVHPLAQPDGRNGLLPPSLRVPQVLGTGKAPLLKVLVDGPLVEKGLLPPDIRDGRLHHVVPPSHSRVGVGDFPEPRPVLWVGLEGKDAVVAVVSAGAALVWVLWIVTLAVTLAVTVTVLVSVLVSVLVFVRVRVLELARKEIHRSHRLGVLVGFQQESSVDPNVGAEVQKDVVAAISEAGWAGFDVGRFLWL